MRVTFETNEDIQQHIQKSGHKSSVIHRAANGLPIYCVQLGGSKSPPIVITAGSHASEPAGVVGALRLLTELKTDHAVYVVPNRDPMGLEGYHRYLKFALGGEEPHFSTNTELADLLRQRGQVVHDDRNLIVNYLSALPQEISKFGIRREMRRSEEHTSELQSHSDLVCRLLLEK